MRHPPSSPPSTRGFFILFRNWLSPQNPEMKGYCLSFGLNVDQTREQKLKRSIRFGQVSYSTTLLNTNPSPCTPPMPSTMRMLEYGTASIIRLGFYGFNPLPHDHGPTLRCRVAIGWLSFKVNPCNKKEKRAESAGQLGTATCRHRTTEARLCASLRDDPRTLSSLPPEKAISLFALLGVHSSIQASCIPGLGGR